MKPNDCLLVLFFLPGLLSSPFWAGGVHTPKTQFGWVGRRIKDKTLCALILQLIGSRTNPCLYQIPLLSLPTLILSLSLSQSYQSRPCEYIQSSRLHLIYCGNCSLKWEKKINWLNERNETNKENAPTGKIATPWSSVSLPPCQVYSGIVSHTLWIAHSAHIPTFSLNSFACSFIIFLISVLVIFKI